MDNLPVATKVVSDLRPNDPYYIRGFPVGGMIDDKHFVFNHIRLIISYNEDHNPGERTVPRPWWSESWSCMHVLCLIHSMPTHCSITSGPLHGELLYMRTSSPAPFSFPKPDIG